MNRKKTLRLALRYIINNKGVSGVYLNFSYCSLNLKRKAVPLQVFSGTEGSRKLRFPDFMTTAQDSGKVVSLYAPAAFTPKKYSWYSFLLEAESTPGP